jgi:hypothetical protein
MVTMDTSPDSPRPGGRVRVVITPHGDPARRARSLREVIGRPGDAGPRAPRAAASRHRGSRLRTPRRAVAAGLWLSLVVGGTTAVWAVQDLVAPRERDFLRSDLWLPVPRTPAEASAIELQKAAPPESTTSSTSTSTSTSTTIGGTDGPGPAPGGRSSTSGTDGATSVAASSRASTTSKGPSSPSGGPSVGATAAPPVTSPPSVGSPRTPPPTSPTSGPPPSTTWDDKGGSGSSGTGGSDNAAKAAADAAKAAEDAAKAAEDAAEDAEDAAEDAAKAAEDAAKDAAADRNRSKD